MHDSLKKFFTEPHTVGIILTSAVVGAIAGLAQGVVEKRHGGWGGFLRAVLTGIVVAVIVGLGIEGFVGSETLRLAIVGACAVVSEDIWTGLKILGGGLRKDPLGFLARLIEAFRGRGGAARQAGSTQAPSKDERGNP